MFSPVEHSSTFGLKIKLESLTWVINSRTILGGFSEWNVYGTGTAVKRVDVARLSSEVWSTALLFVKVFVGGGKKNGDASQFGCRLAFWGLISQLLFTI